MFALPQVDKTCNGSVPSSCENSFRMDCPASLPLVGAAAASAPSVFIDSLKGLRGKRGAPVSRDARPAVWLTHCAVFFPVRAPQVFSNLDGVVQQRRQEMMESSSSGSQTPDYDKITGVCLAMLRSSGGIPSPNDVSTIGPLAPIL